MPPKKAAKANLLYAASVQHDSDLEDDEAAALPLVSASPFPLPPDAVIAAGRGDVRSPDGVGAGTPDASGRSPIARAIIGAASQVQERAQEWAELCARDAVGALLQAIKFTLELAGLALKVELADLDGGPDKFVQSLPDRAREGSTDPSVYPLLPKSNAGKKAVASLEKFWSIGIVARDQALLDGDFLETMAVWLLTMSRVPIRSLRHVATVSVMAIGDTMGQLTQALVRTRDALHTQVAAAAGSRNKRQQAQLELDANEASELVNKLYAARSKLLEGTVPARSRDVSDDIRLHTLSAVDRLMRKDPETFLQNRFMARVFLMTHDPCADVRLKAIQVIHNWYTTQNYSEAVKKNLSEFVARFLVPLVERTADVEPRVVVAALKCLRLPALAKELKDKEFDEVVNLCVGSKDMLVREEAAMFINAHVFQDPGICVAQKKQHRRGAAAAAAEDEDADGERRDGEDVRDTVKDLYDSETSLSMLMEFIESYIAPRMRITERAVGAFWGHAPSLGHWGTMVNLCLIGEAQRAGLEPLKPIQRLALLYIMEASVRRAKDDTLSNRWTEKDAAAAKLHDACAHIIPELPQLMKVCLPEKNHALLISHICKILVEYAVENSQNQVLVNPRALCEWLVKYIDGQSSLDTSKYCTDCLVSLARCFNEAKTCFLDLAKGWHHKCVNLLSPDPVDARSEEIHTAMSKYVVLANRAIDMSFGSTEVQPHILNLLDKRVTWSAKVRGSAGEAAESAADTQLDDTAAAEAEKDLPPGVPDARLALQLLEAATLTAFWHIKMVSWMAAESNMGAAKAQIAEMMQDLGDFASLQKRLVPDVRRLRDICIAIIKDDLSPVVKFHAFSAYMSIGQYAVAVSDKLALDATNLGVGDMYEVTVSRGHNEVLWNYLNGMYQELCQAEDLSEAIFDIEGQRVQTLDIYPVPSMGTMTAPRFLTTACMEGTGETSAEKSLPLERKMFIAVLASRMVSESEVEDIIAGPLGMLLLLQADRGCPSVLRQVALGFLKRLMSMARTSEDYAVLYFNVQARAILSLFSCAGLEAAQALSGQLLRHWGVRMAGFLEPVMFAVLRETLQDCITTDEKMIPLLSVFCAWISKVEDHSARARGEDFADMLLARCAETGIDAGEQQSVQELVKYFRSLASRRVEAEAEPGPEAPLDPPLAEEPPSIARRITGKRSPADFEVAKQETTEAKRIKAPPRGEDE